MCVDTCIDGLDGAAEFRCHGASPIAVSIFIPDLKPSVLDALWPAGPTFCVFGVLKGFSASSRAQNEVGIMGKDLYICTCSHLNNSLPFSLQNH